MIMWIVISNSLDIDFIHGDIRMLFPSYIIPDLMKPDDEIYPD